MSLSINKRGFTELKDATKMNLIYANLKKIKEKIKY